MRMPDIHMCILCNGWANLHYGSKCSISSSILFLIIISNIARIVIYQQILEFIGAF